MIGPGACFDAEEYFCDAGRIRMRGASSGIIFSKGCDEICRASRLRAPHSLLARDTGPAIALGAFSSSFILFLGLCL
jgi:hypothetical protein